MYRAYVKRLLDSTSAIVLLVVLAAPLLIVIIWIKCDSKGPVFFRQQRSGKDRIPFTIVKFRTMSVDAPRNQPTNGFISADRFITRSGRIMRKLSIDELPQLLNVIRGDMSLVGPRPVLLQEERLLNLRDQYRANTVKPGITGLAQVSGRDELDDWRKAELDGVYVTHFGVKTDVLCLLNTVTTVLSFKGHHEGTVLAKPVLDTGLAAKKAI